MSVIRLLYRLRHVLAAVLLAAIATTPAPESGSPAAAWPEPVPTPVRRSDLPGAFTREVPASLDDLRAIQTRVEKLVADLSSSVVAVQIGQISGSAVIISTNGLVLTAGHVCGRPNRDVRLLFPDGRTQRGKTLGVDLGSDIGLIRITDPGSWPAVKLGDLKPVRVGDWVLALGHPGGFDRQRSLVARLGRIIQAEPEALRTDCTITTGDSGGPLFDLSGRVIGVHSFISESTADNYHIPVSHLYAGWNQLVRGGSGAPAPPRVYVGASSVDGTGGCRLAAVEKDSPASQAGLRTGDLVLKVDGRAIKASAAFQRWIAEGQPGETLDLEIERDGHQLTVTVKLAKPPRNH